MLCYLLLGSQTALFYQANHEEPYESSHRCEMCWASLHIHTCFFFVCIHGGQLQLPCTIPDLFLSPLTVCQSNRSPVQLCCTQYSKARKVCIQFMEALTSYRSSGTKCGSGCISAAHHGVRNRLCVSERYEVIVGNCVFDNRDWQSITMWNQAKGVTRKFFLGLEKSLLLA